MARKKTATATARPAEKIEEEVTATVDIPKDAKPLPPTLSKGKVLRLVQKEWGCDEATFTGLYNDMVGGRGKPLTDIQRELCDQFYNGSISRKRLVKELTSKGGAGNQTVVGRIILQYLEELNEDDDDETEQD